MSEDNAFRLLGWETALTTEIPDHIVLSLLFATREENKRAGKLNRVRWAIPRKQALEISKDLAQAANTEAPRSGPH